MLRLLNLDQSLPTSDANWRVNGANVANAATLRFLGAGDPLRVETLQRWQGDVAHRFHLVESAVNGVVSELLSNPYLRSFDDTPYVKVNGSRPFLAPVSSPEPVLALHLANKSYVDRRNSETSTEVDVLRTQLQGFVASSVRPFYSNWVEHTWHSGSLEEISLPLLTSQSAIPDYSLISAISVIERLDVAQPSGGNPNPPVQYVYNQLTPGAVTGFRIDAAWIDPASHTVRVLIPNQASYPSYPASPTYLAQSAPRRRWLRAMVLTGGGAGGGGSAPYAVGAEPVYSTDFAEAPDGSWYDTGAFHYEKRGSVWYKSPQADPLP